MKTEVRWLMDSAKYKDVSPKKVAGELDQLSIKTDEGVSQIELEAMIKKARSRSSAMHTLFTWDNRKAANKWRRSEARFICANLVEVRIEEGEEKGPTRVWVNTAQGEMSKTREVFGNDIDSTEWILDRAHAELVSWTKRYERYKELANEISVIKELIDA